jgi:glutathione S-transferase
LEECSKNTAYSIEVYKRQSNKLAPPELKAVHPLGKSPLVTVAAPSLSEPIVLAESAAICEYLCDHFAPHLIPTRYREGFEGKVGGETEQWLRYRFYMHYAEGSLMSLLTVAMFMDSKFQSLRFAKLTNTGQENVIEKSTDWMTSSRHPQLSSALLH